MATKKAPDLTADKRVCEMAACVLHAVNSFPNSLVSDHAMTKIESWQTWYKRVLTEAGFKLVEKKPAKKKARG
jgi:hypothetical protein